MSEHKTINQWISVNNIQNTLKLICIGLVFVSTMLVILCLNLQDKTPTVVKDTANDLHFLIGSKKPVPIQKENIERFIKKFIDLRYEWNGSLNINRISKDISPFVTKGFNRKTVQKLKKLKNKDFKGKVLDQGYTNPKITINDTSTIANFDRVFRINGTPLTIPTEISFNLVKGEISYWNRLGLYINGITIHEGI